MKTVSIERLRQVLDLREDGTLVWKQRPARGRVHESLEAGGLMLDGYKRVSVDGVALKQHRVVWALAYGEWPPEQVDHIDGDRANNRPSNLRLAGEVGNQRNVLKHCRNTSGYRGVYWDKRVRRWKSMIMVRGKSVFLGYFDIAREAAEAYVLASLEFYGEFSPFNRKTA